MCANTVARAAAGLTTYGTTRAGLRAYIAEHRHEVERHEVADG
jgi:hypothetical protein